MGVKVKCPPAAPGKKTKKNHSRAAGHKREASNLLKLLLLSEETSSPSQMLSYLYRKRSESEYTQLRAVKRQLLFLLSKFKSR